MKTQLAKLIPAFLFAAVLNVPALTRYVDLNSPSPTPPYLDWTTAATNIQDAIDAAVDGDLVLVTNGIYNSGGQTNGGFYLTNRVVVDKALTLQSVNGPSVTSIEGGTALRCVYLTNGATMVGFTITNGATIGNGGDIYYSGAGAYCAATDVVISNCVFVGNSATGFGQTGGGVCGGTLFDCLLVGNQARDGAGAFNSALYNCTVVSNTATSSGAGVYGSTLGGLNGSLLENCVVEFNTAPRGAGFAGLGTINNSLFRSNSATAGNGGGALGGVFSNCVFVGNQALGSAASTGRGGGAFGGAYFTALNSCTFSNNVAQRAGGGVDSGTLTNCTLTGNTSSVGGGANGATLYNCIVSGNVADASGGGTSSNLLVNCAVNGNSARLSGGGSYFDSLTNCLVTGNSAASGGGIVGGDSWNSIVYYNHAYAHPNYLSNTMNYCCASPLPSAGLGNISESPQLVDQYHLSVASPCIGAGNTGSASGVDLDGEAWNVPPALGCDEYYSGTATGILSVAIVIGENDSTTGFATGFLGSLSALITGNASSNFWDFGDGTFATNQPSATHSWAAPGLYLVKMWVYNADNSGGVVAERTVPIVDQPVHLVYAGNATPVAPYLSWETAATNIQDAVDVAFGGSSILVSNGVYGFGGKVAYDGLNNRVAVTRPLAVRSVNGALHTIIQGVQVPGTTNGDGATRCVLLANGASLEGFTLTNGATLNYGGMLVKSDQDFRGGGIWCASTNEVISNCVVVANAAYAGAAAVNAGTLNNCALSNNIGSLSSYLGSGAHLSVLNDCIVSGNHSGTHPDGGAVTSVLMNNCLVVSNSTVGANRSILNSCTIIGNAGGGANSCTLINCVIKSNYTTQPSAAGGASASNLRDCQVIGNSGVSGGGLNNSSATNCLISGNSASQSGGGVFASVVPSSNVFINNCTITNNTAKDGGGVSGASAWLVNCVVAGNRAINNGGGANGGRLDTCQILDNAAKDGGGAYGAYITNGVISGNWATNNGGGAALGAYLVNCLVTHNSATNIGGGAISCTLVNATVVNNIAGNAAGGASQGTLRNSILYYNSANSSPNFNFGSAINCCSVPAPPGSGNFADAPQFIDPLAGNYRLQTNSPCIGAGNNGYIVPVTDLDGRPRIVGGTVDVGAYEFQGAGVGEFTAWLEQFALPTDGSADFADSDSDNMNNYGEWRSDTIPTNAVSVLRMVSATDTPTGASVSWQSVATRSYWLERATNLGAAPSFASVATNIIGVAGTKAYTDTSATNGGPYFYRVGVQ